MGGFFFPFPKAEAEAVLRVTWSIRRGFCGYGKAGGGDFCGERSNVSTRARDGGDNNDDVSRCS